ncbi:MAG: class I SAM-dependent methyltransferase [Solirubrobacteraceae bacterium]
MAALEPNKVHEIETAEASKNAPHAWTKPFGSEWGSHYWGKWQTISFALYSLGVERGSSLLDVGAGGGWTTIFLAESGYLSVGVDIAPAHIEVAKQRAARYGSSAEFLVRDMDTLALDRSFDGALVFDALHHSLRPAQVVERVAAHVRPGGWVLFAEPSWLHDLSPSARRVSKQMGWVEKGVRVRSLKGHCSAAGLGNFRRFYEGTAPYAGKARDLGWQAARLLGARLSTAPQMSVWVAAQKLDRRTAISHP